MQRFMLRDLTESLTPGMSWIHFHSVDFAAHLFVFGCGSITSFQDADEKLAKSGFLQKQIQSVDASEAIILSGHSMGAAWATLINNMLVQRGRPQDKRVLVTSGTPLVDLKYLFFKIEMSHAIKSKTCLFLKLFPPHPKKKFFESMIKKNCQKGNF